MPAVEAIVHEHDFKIVCDGLLRREVSPFVQTFAGKGRDGGIDAEYDGSFASRSGRSIFQYKFIGPDVGQVTARKRLIEALADDFNKARALRPKPRTYVALTNVAATVATLASLRQLLAKELPTTKLVVWDRSTLNVLLREHAYLARSWSGIIEEHCRTAIVIPVTEWLWAAAASNAPLWPLVLVDAHWRERTDTFVNPFVAQFGWKLSDTSDEPRQLINHPLYDHAASVAFPSSLRGISNVLRQAARLAGDIRTFVDSVAEAMQSGSIAMLPDDKRQHCALPLAFTAIEIAWKPETATHMPQIIKDKITLGSVLLYEGPVPDQLGSRLNDDVRRLRATGMPRHLVAARARLQKATVACWKRAWWAATLGVDYDPSAR